MNIKKVIIFTGQQFTVPQGIQRIDSKSTHGWQVRYHGTKMFSDHSQDGSGAGHALVMATKELLRRIAEYPAPASLRKTPAANKTSNLPAGISGPIVRTRADSHISTAHLSVVLPRFGQPPGCGSVHIGSENTYTVAKYKAALAKAVALRKQAEDAYEMAATAAKRKDARTMKAALRKGV